jgi:hypothetical protein
VTVTWVLPETTWLVCAQKGPGAAALAGAANGRMVRTEANRHAANTRAHITVALFMG